MSIDFIVGGPARNRDFLYRADFVEDLWDSLRTNNVLLLAPRRMGKTSVMYNLLDQPRFNYKVVHLNVEHLETPQAFFIHLLDALQTHQPNLLKRLGEKLSFLSGLVDRLESLEFGEIKLALRDSGTWHDDWRGKAEELFDVMYRSQEPILFSIDELPDMIVAMEKQVPDDLGPFLHLFRHYRTAHDSPIRWLIGGSVNLRGTLDQRGMIQLVNDLRVEILPPFSEENLRDFVTRSLMQRDVAISEDLLPRMQNLLGTPIPFFLQLFTQELYRYWRRNSEQKLSAEHADHVFNKALLGEVARDKLQHFRSRIFLYYPEARHDIACRLLDRLSITQNGLARGALHSQFRKLTQESGENHTESQAKQEFEQLLTRLQSDFYVEEVGNGHLDFVNRVLKSWWSKYYGYNYDS